MVGIVRVVGDSEPVVARKRADDGKYRALLSDLGELGATRAIVRLDEHPRVTSRGLNRVLSAGDSELRASLARTETEGEYLLTLA